MFRVFHGIATVGNGALCLGSLVAGQYGVAAFQGALAAWLISQQLNWYR